MNSATHREIPATATSRYVPGVALQDCRSASPASADVYACGRIEQRTRRADFESFVADMRKVEFVFVEADPVMLGKLCKVDWQLLWLWFWLCLWLWLRIVVFFGRADDGTQRE